MYLSATPQVAILGAGTLGCYLGGLLSPHASVTLIGSADLMSAVDTGGITIEPYNSRSTHIPPSQLSVTSDPAAVRHADFVLVCTKAPDALSAIRSAQPHLSTTSLVIGLQNGLHTVDAIHEELDANPVATIVAPFTVTHVVPTTFRQVINGKLVLEDSDALASFAQLVGKAEIPHVRVRNMPAVLHGQVLITLNNAIQALSGKPLREELLDRDYRLCLAQCMSEALRCFAAAGVIPRLPLTVPAPLLPTLLRLPSPLFRAAARAVVDIDVCATSSMSADLAHGRPTEIDELQGAVVHMGRRLGVPTAACERVVQLVHDSEAQGPNYRNWSGPALRAELDSTVRHARTR